MTQQQIINVGVTENDGTGDSIQTAGSKINHNFSQLYTDNEIESTQITFIENNITATASNANLVLTAAGNGSIQLADVKVSGTSLSSDDSTGININENVNVDGTVTATTYFGSAAGITGATISTVGDLSATGSTLIAPSNADLTFSFSGTGSLVMPAITINDNNIIGTRSNDDINLDASLSGAINVTDITIDSSFRLKDNEITAIRSNDSINLVPSGTGSVVMSKVDANAGTVDGTTLGATTPAAGTFTTIEATTLSTTGITITDNEIKASQSNDKLIFTGSGSGSVLVNGFTLPSSDGSSGQILQTDGSKTLSFATSPLILGVSTFADTTQDISFRSLTELNANTALGGHEIVTTGQVTMDSFATSKYDSAWYHVVTKDVTNTQFAVAKYSLLTGTTNDGSTTGAFLSQSNIVRSSTNTHITADASVSGSNTQLLGTGTSADNAIRFYRIGLGDNDSSTTSGNITTIVNADVDSASESLDTFAHASYRGAKYYVSAENTDNGEVQNLEALVIHNGSDAFINVHNSHFSGNNSLLTLTAGITGSNVVLSGAALTPNTKVRMYRVLLSDSESSSSGDNVSVIGATTVSNISQTTIDTNSFRGTANPDFSSTQTASTFATTDFDSVWYHVINRDQTNSEFNMEKLSVMHGTTTDGSTQNAFITSSSIVKSGVHNDVMSYDVDIDGSNVRLRGTGVSDGSSTISNSMTYYALGLGQNTADATSGNIGTEAGIILGGNNETALDAMNATGTTQGSVAETRTAATFTAGTYDAAMYFTVTKDIEHDSFEFKKLSICHNLADAFITSSQVVRSDPADQHATFDADIVTASDSSSLVRLRMTDSDGSSVTPSNTLAYYRQGLGDGDSAGYVGEFVLINDIMHTDIIDSAVTTLDAISHGAHVGAKYFITVNNQSTGEVGNIEALVTHDGTNAYITTYNEFFSGNNSLITLTADISGTSFRLRASATAGGSTKVIVNRVVAFGDSESSEANSDSSRKVIGNTIVSSSATTFDTFSSDDVDAAHYIITGQKGSDENFICEAAVVTDGSNVFVSQGPNVSTKENDMLAITATISGTTVSVKASSTSGSSTVQAYAVKIKAPTTSATTMDSWAHASYRGAKYYISAEDTDNGNISNLEALVVHNGSEAFITVSNEHFSNSRLVTLTATLSGSTVSIDATPLSGDIRIKFYRIRLADNESDSSGTDANTIGAVTISSGATAIDTFDDTQHTGAHYVMVANNATEGAASISEFTVVTDGTDASVAQGPEVSTKESGQIFLTAAHNGSSTITISASSTSGGSTTVNAYRIHMLRPAATSYTILDSFASGTYNGAHYVVVAKKVGATDSQISEIQAVTNGSDTFVNSDPIVSSTGSNLINYTGGNTGSTAEVRAEAADGTSSFTANAYRINMLRGSGSSSSLTTLDSFDKTEQRSVKYLVQIHRTDDDKFEFADVNVTHDGTNAYLSVFGQVGTQTTNLATYSADISGDNVRLRGEVAGTQDHTIKIVKRNLNI